VGAVVSLDLLALTPHVLLLLDFALLDLGAVVGGPDVTSTDGIVEVAGFVDGLLDALGGDEMDGYVDGMEEVSVLGADEDVGADVAGVHSVGGPFTKSQAPVLQQVSIPM